jgi:hypothetical protein
MEDTPKKTLDQHIKEADEKGLQVVLIGTGAEDGKHAMLLAKMIKSGKVFPVLIQNLPEEDQKRISEMGKPTEIPSAMIIKPTPELELPEIKTDFIAPEGNKAFGIGLKKFKKYNR